MQRTATVCFLLQKRHVLLVKIQYPSGEEKWTGIGGIVDEGEVPEECLVREIEEETELKVKKKDLRKITEIEFEKYTLLVYTTDTWGGKVEAKDPSIIEMRWFGKDELPLGEMHEQTEKWLPEILNDKVGK